MLNSSFIKIILVTLSLQIYGMLHAGGIFFTSGTDFNQAGEMRSDEMIKIECGNTFKGSGTLTAPEIEIIAESFDFTGTLNCNKRCQIIVKNEFNQNMFKRLGNGEFIITIDPSFDLSTKKQRPSNFTNFKAQRSVIKEFLIQGKSISFTLEVFLEEEAQLIEALQSGNKAEAEQILNNFSALQNNINAAGFLLLTAGICKQFTIVEKILSSYDHIDLDIIDRNLHLSMPLLIIAVLENDPEFVRTLLRNGAHPNTIDTNKRTALMFAADRGYVEIVKDLLEAGADKNLCDISGFKALDCVPPEQKEILTMLTQKNPTLNKEVSVATSPNQNNSNNIKVSEPQPLSTQDKMTYMCVGLGIGYLAYCDLKRFIANSFR